MPLFISQNTFSTKEEEINTIRILPLLLSSDGAPFCYFLFINQNAASVAATKFRALELSVNTARKAMKVKGRTDATSCK